MPQPKRYWISDPHIGHRLMAQKRGFYTGGTEAQCVQRHDDFIADTWDSEVSDQDTVFLLGDLAMNTNYGISWLAARPGKKVLILGNHDAGFAGNSKFFKELRQYDWVSDLVVCNGGRVRLYNGTEVLMSHFPYIGTPDRYPRPDLEQWALPDRGTVLLHGHTHNASKSSRSTAGTLMIHCGWDAWSKMIHESEIVELIESQGK